MDTTNLDDLLNQAEAQEQNQNNWQMDLRYESKEFYIDEHGAVEIRNKTIGDMSKHISVKGESYSQYIEFKTNRFYDGVDLTKMLLSIYFEIPNVGSDENRPVNVYYNDNEIKFGWAIPDIVSQKSSTLNLCIYARGKLEDGKTYLLKTKTTKYTINEGLDIGSGIIEPTENWYLDFVLQMDEKVQIATDAATEALASKESAKQSETYAMQSKNEVNQKSSNVDSKHSEVVTMHKETKQFRDEAEQFRNEAERFTPDGYSNLIEQVYGNTDEIEEINESINSGFKKVESGEDIHITDSVDASIPEFHLFGKSKQNTTQGNQLANLPDLDATLNTGITWSCKNGVVTAVGTATEDAFSSYVNLLHDIPIIAGDYFISGSKNNVHVRTVVSRANGANNVYDNESFTLDGTETRVRVYIFIVKGDTVNATIYPMLNKGTSVLPWEPYTGGQPSPNPEYKQDIEVPTNPIVKSRGGEQLANLPDIPITIYPGNGIEYSCKNGAITLKGSTGNYAFSTQAVQLFYDVPIISGDYFISGSKGDVKVFAQITKNGLPTAYYIENRFKLDGTETKCRIYCQIDANKTVNETVYPMLNKGTTALPFEPYKETEAVIQGEYAGIPVSSGGNYTDSNGQQWICDEIVKYADGSGEKIQRVGKVVFDGDENFEINANGILATKSRNPDLFNDVKLSLNNECRAMSNIRKWVAGNSWGVGSFGFETGTFWFEDKGHVLFPTLSDWYNYLSETNMHVLYELAEPIHTLLTAEEISEIEKLHTFSPITNISNNAECGMQVTYYTVKEADMLNQSYYTSKKNEKDISVIQKELRETTFKVDTIIDKADLGIKNTASGEDIHVTDSANAKNIEFHLFGKAKQETTSGNQLLNYDAWKKVGSSRCTTVFENNGITITATNDDAFTSYSSTDFPEEAKIQVSEGEIITLSWEEATNTSGIVFIFQNGNVNGNVWGDNAKVKKLSYTVPSGVTFVTFRFGVQNAGDTIAYKNIMINKGTTALPWEKFTGGQPSPSPEFPQEIEVPSGAVVVKSCGNQLFDASTIESGLLEVNGNLSLNNSWESCGYILVRPLSVYTISQNIKNYFRYRFCFYDSDKKFISAETVQKYDVKEHTFTTPQNTTYMRVTYAILSNGEALNRENIMLNKGTTALPFEPYKETTATIQGEYAGIPVSSGGNYTDQNGQQWIANEIVKYADGSGERVQRVNKYKVTSKSTFIGYKSLGNYARCTINEKDINTTNNAKLKAFSNIFPNLADYTSDKLHFYVDQGGIYVFVPIEELDTQDEYGVKSWLISKNAEFLYALKEPIRTPLTAEEIAEIEKLQTFNPITNISNDADCGMSVTYLADSKLYIDNQLALQAQAREEEMMSMFLLLPEETQAAMIENDTNNLLLESEE